MVAGLLITTIYCLAVWLVFFRLKLMRFTPGWGVISALIGVHVLLIFLIWLRFVTPSSTDAKVVQHTIQLIPRLPEPTLVTDVLVEEGAQVKKGQTLFQFDRTVYESKVQQLEAQLAEAKQNVKMLEADVAVADGKRLRIKAELTYDQYMQNLTLTLEKEQVGRQEEAERWGADARQAEASLDEAEAELKRAELALESQINGVNTSVATIQAQLEQARFYLENTTLAAPEDGRIVNLQVRRGMVSGIYRIGGIAALIADADRYVLATYYQENLKYVQPGQPVEVAFDLYPGQIFRGRVDTIWKANGSGQYLPSDEIPKFHPLGPDVPQGQYAVKIILDDSDVSKFTIGAQATAAIYTDGEKGAWAALRKISIRAHSWFNWLYPLPF